MESKNNYPPLITETRALELKGLMEEEYGKPFTLREAFEFGEALMCWCIMAPQRLGPERRAAIKMLLNGTLTKAAVPPAPPKLSEQESRALTFIRRSLKAGRSPSVRQVCRELGFRSSRSGLRVIDKLKAKGCVRRDKHGVLKLHRSGH